MRAGWVLMLALAGAPALAGPAVQSWLTTGDRSRLLAPAPAGRFESAGSEAAAAPLIEIDTDSRHQTMAGFGAAITDASAWLIRHRLDETQRRDLMQSLFGRGEEGAGFSLARLTIGASDFSLKHYSLDDRPPGETDMALAHFSIDENRETVLPVVRQALALNPALQIMASPWSAPAWMKTSGSLLQGSLRPEMHEVFARYLLRYVDAYAAEGVPVFALTLQNEPHFEPEDYPGMRLMPAQRIALIAEHLGPMIEVRSGPRPQLIEWDHNWDQPGAPLAVLADDRARSHVAGVGWHCYGGHVQAQQQVREAHPDKDVWFTECSGGEWAPGWAQSLLWQAEHLLIGSTRAWARGVLLWNLALDERHGPHLGGCKDCRGVVTIDAASGAVTRNPEFYVLAHGSRFVRPGAWRIASTAALAGGTLQNVAFLNADDGSRVLVVSNAATRAQRFSVRERGEARGQVLHYSLPAQSLATLVWRP